MLEWAAEVCDIPVRTISALARLYASKRISWRPLPGKVRRVPIGTACRRTAQSHDPPGRQTDIGKDGVSVC